MFKVLSSCTDKPYPNLTKFKAGEWLHNYTRALDIYNYTSLSHQDCPSPVILKECLTAQAVLLQALNRNPGAVVHMERVRSQLGTMNQLEWLKIIPDFSERELSKFSPNTSRVSSGEMSPLTRESQVSTMLSDPNSLQLSESHETEVGFHANSQPF